MAKPIKNCPIDQTLQVISGKWKAVIIHVLLEKSVCRFSELQARLKNCSRRMLALQLKELERDGILTKRVHSTVPVTTDYTLTDRGKRLKPVIDSMQDWGNR